MRLAVAVLAAGLLAVAAGAATHRIVPAENSRFTLEVDKTGLMSGKTHVFVFHRYSGEVTYDEARPSDSHVRLVIESGSVECKDDWVSAKDLKKIQQYAVEKMLFVERYPELVFVSNEVTKLRENDFLVDGQLTIRETTRPARVMVRLARRVGGGFDFEGDASVNMKDYGLKPPKAAFGLIGTKELMRVSFNLTAKATQ